MDTTSLIVAIALGIVVLSYFLIAYFSARTWHILSVLASVGILLGAVGFMILAAAVLKTHAHWRGSFNQLTAQLETVNEQIEILRDGRPEDAATNPRRLTAEQHSLRSVRELLNLLTQSRGRVWRGAAPGQAGNAETLRIPGDPQVPHGITPGMTLYAFTETQAGSGVPAGYVSELRVLDAPDARTIRAEPMQPILGGQGTWVLYELTPADSHDVFAGMNEQQLQGLFAQVGLRADANQMAHILEPYLRDGGPARRDDPNERRWVRVRFVQPHRIDVDAPADVGTTESAIDPITGLAVSSALKQGGPSTFEPDDEATFDLETAEDLLGRGIARRVEGEADVFRRLLHDYAFEIRELVRQIQLADERISVLESDNELLTQTDAKVQAQIAILKESIDALTHDETGFARELTVITDYHQAVRSEFDSRRQEIGALYATNKQLLVEFSSLQREAARQIDQRVGELDLPPPLTAVD